MAKAYDRVEWVYLRSIMLKLGFSASFVNLIMKCVETIKLFVRDIQQGDPISPFLFLLCAEGLYSLMKFWVPNYLANGIRVGLHVPWPMGATPAFFQ
jgi:hypothetical protein